MFDVQRRCLSQIGELLVCHVGEGRERGDSQGIESKQGIVWRRRKPVEEAQDELRLKGVGDHGGPEPRRGVNEEIKRVRGLEDEKGEEGGEGRMRCDSMMGQ